MPLLASGVASGYPGHTLLYAPPPRSHPICSKEPAMNPASLAKLFATVIALIGPAPADSPKELQLKPGDKIVAIGDSITAAGGYLTATSTLFLANDYPDLKIPKIINAGIGGQKAEDLLPRFKKDVVDRKPQWVTLSIGINDVWHRLGKPHDPKVLEKYTENVSKMVDMAQEAGIKVILLSPTDHSRRRERRRATSGCCNMSRRKRKSRKRRSASSSICMKTL